MAWRISFWPKCGTWCRRCPLWSSSFPVLPWMWIFSSDTSANVRLFTVSEINEHPKCISYHVVVYWQNWMDLMIDSPEMFGLTVHGNLIFKHHCMSSFKVKGRPFDVKTLFLEDILRTTGYTSKEMAKYKAEMQKGELYYLSIISAFKTLTH